MPSITQLEYILAVDEHRHFGQAAKVCHISQPTLSQQIQKIEDELGIIIFDRIKKPIIPTPEGKLFISQAKIVVNEHQRLLHIAKKGEHGLQGDFRLGIIPTISSFLLPLFLKDFSQKYPKVELFIEELKTENIIAMLEKDKLDGAILATPLHQQHLKEHPLFYEPMYLFFSDKHKLLDKKIIDENDLDNTEMWLLHDGNCFKNQVADYCSLNPDFDTVFKNVHFQSGNLETIKNLVKQTKGFTMIPALMLGYMTSKEKEKNIRSFKSPLPAREISFIYRRDHWKLEMIEALKNLIINHLPSDVEKSKSKKIKLLEIC